MAIEKGTAQFSVDFVILNSKSTSDIIAVTSSRPDTGHMGICKVKGISIFESFGQFRYMISILIVGGMVSYVGMVAIFAG